MRGRPSVAVRSGLFDFESRHPGVVESTEPLKPSQGVTVAHKWFQGGTKIDTPSDGEYSA